MFDTSFPEMLVIFVIALLVLGPERLPRVARTVGLWVGRARATFARLRTELEREVNLQELQDAQRELQQSLSASEKAISESMKPVVEVVESVPQEMDKEASAPPSADGKQTDADNDDQSKQATP